MSYFDEIAQKTGLRRLGGTPTGPLTSLAFFGNTSPCLLETGRLETGDDVLSILLYGYDDNVRNIISSLVLPSTAVRTVQYDTYGIIRYSSLPVQYPGYDITIHESDPRVILIRYDTVYVSYEMMVQYRCMALTIIDHTLLL